MANDKQDFHADECVKGARVANLTAPTEAKIGTNSLGIKFTTTDDLKVACSSSTEPILNFIPLP